MRTERSPELKADFMHSKTSPPTKQVLITPTPSCPEYRSSIVYMWTDERSHTKKGIQVSKPVRTTRYHDSLIPIQRRCAIWLAPILFDRNSKRRSKQEWLKFYMEFRLKRLRWADQMYRLTPLHQYPRMYQSTFASTSQWVFRPHYEGEFLTEIAYPTIEQ